MLVAALQRGPAGSSIAATADRILALVDKAGAAGVALGVLPELALTPCVVVSSEEDGRLIAQLWPEAVRHSRTLGLLRDRVRVEPAVRVAPPT